MQSIRTPAELRCFYSSVLENNGGKWFDFEPIIQSVYEELLVPGDSAIDAGAHRGRHSIPMARKVAPHGRVFAFEPIHKLAWLLQAFIRVHSPDLVDVIRVNELALSRFSGTAEFLVADEPAYSGLKPRVYPRPDMLVQNVRVSVDTLDNRCSGIQRLRFIKLDLEGGEFDAMVGASRLIERNRPVLAFEYDSKHSPGFYGFAQSDFLHFFEKLNYEIVDVLGVPFADPALWTAAKVWYYFAMPKEQGLLSRITTFIEQVAHPFIP